MFTKNNKNLVLVFCFISVPYHKCFLFQDKFTELSVRTTLNTVHNPSKSVRNDSYKYIHHNNSHESTGDDKDHPRVSVEALSGEVTKHCPVLKLEVL
jgi:hypothetical protein